MSRTLEMGRVLVALMICAIVLMRMFYLHEDGTFCVIMISIASFMLGVEIPKEKLDTLITKFINI